MIEDFLSSDGGVMSARRWWTVWRVRVADVSEGSFPGVTHGIVELQIGASFITITYATAHLHHLPCRHLARAVALIELAA
jgi:hypothetical protein